MPAAAAPNIFICGFMCCGKTLAGRALARLLRRPFADTDALLAKEHGAPAGDLIRRRGLGAFRRLEDALVRRLAAVGGRVIALGGGYYPSGKRAAVLKSGVAVFLDCPWPELRARIAKSAAARPLLAGGAERAKKLFTRRLPYYRRAAIRVGAGGLTPAAAAQKIKKALK